MMQQFAKLRVTAPLYKSELAKAIEELTSLHDSLQEKGESEKNGRINRFIKYECYYTKVKAGTNAEESN